MQKRLDKREVVDSLRELYNWIAVFEAEYELPYEAAQTLRKGVAKVARALEDMGSEGHKTRRHVYPERGLDWADYEDWDAYIERLERYEDLDAQAEYLEEHLNQLAKT
jgi:hypothetical protein